MSVSFNSWVQDILTYMYERIMIISNILVHQIVGNNLALFVYENVFVSYSVDIMIYLICVIEYVI